MASCDISGADFLLEVDSIYNFIKELHAQMNPSDQSQILYPSQKQEKPTVSYRLLKFLNIGLHAFDSKETHSTSPFKSKKRRLYE